jgi:LmbE family N-acetylglucosaminyl deacetylase
MESARTLDTEIEDVVSGRGLLLVIAAHPGDDVIGAGALLARTPKARVVYVSSGAPRDDREALAHGFPSPVAYGTARRREAESALSRASIDGSDRVFAFGVADREATFAMVPIARAIATLLATCAPRLVLTHPYEGGHPDHDATAFAVHSAMALLPRADRARDRTVLGEFASYHAGKRTVRRVVFVEDRHCPETLFALDRTAVRLKSEMFACHASQAQALSVFPRDRERFRRAPAYDFARPPNRGRLLYERDGSGAEWGIDAALWLAEAAAARARLGLEAPAVGWAGAGSASAHALGNV